MLSFSPELTLFAGAAMKNWTCFHTFKNTKTFKNQPQTSMKYGLDCKWCLPAYLYY